MNAWPLANKISTLLGLAGITITASEIIATAAQYQTNPNTTLIPGAIWAANQVLLQLPSKSNGLVYAGNYSGAAPTFTPTSSGAIAIDTITLRQWQWANNFWS